MLLRWIYKNNECLIWIGALLWLYFAATPPVQPSAHFSFCIFKLAGLSFCPGCGLGRSMHEAMHGHWLSSWNLHWLGFPAILIISYRILTLIKRQKQHNAQLHDGIAGSSTGGTSRY
jgi:hypothetical membrane protein